MSITQEIGDVAEGFLGFKPLYSSGVRIGNWSGGGGFFDINAQDFMAGVCNQQVDFITGVTPQQMDPTTWTTIDDWGRSIPVQNLCLQKGVIPNWMTQDQANAYVQQSDGSIVPAASVNVLPLVAAGALILVSLALAVR
jgi:hypothetical protein